MFRGSFINSAAESVKDTDKRKNMNRMKQTKQNHFIKIKKKKKSGFYATAKVGDTFSLTLPSFTNIRGEEKIENMK